MMKSVSFLILFVIGARGISDAPRKLMGKMGGGKMALSKTKAAKNKKKKGNSSKHGCQMEFSPERVENLCTLWEVFDNMGRAENNDPAIVGFEWEFLCDDFAPFQDWLCPSEDTVQDGICSHPRPRLNPAIRLHYCGPLLEVLPDGPRREACETWCTNFVSQDRGGCCNIECDDN